MVDSDSVLVLESVVHAVLKIVLLVSVGAKLELQKVLDGPKRKCLSGLAMDVCLPCLLFTSVLPMARMQLLVEGWPLLLWPFFYAPIGALLGAICCAIVGIPYRHLGSAAACAAFPNINGFPVAIIASLITSLPNSPNGFSAMTFLSLIQLTDGVLKYTIGPAVFKLDKYNQAMRKMQSSSCQHLADLAEEDGGELQVGDSLRSFDGSFDPTDNFAQDKFAPEKVAQSHEGTPKSDKGSRKSMGNKTNSWYDFGLTTDQVATVKPEWSRWDSYLLFQKRKANKTPPSLPSLPSIQEPLLAGETPANGQKKLNLGKIFKELLPPQVCAVLIALGIGLGPAWMKTLLIQKPGVLDKPLLGFVYGTAKQLGGGFVPMQMISLGGRLVNIASKNGPLSPSGSVGPRGRNRLLRISGAVLVARMLLAPAVLYVVALSLSSYSKMAPRPLSFWVPALVAAAMPTANNMSTMADLIGSGRSISAASTAMQLLASPIILSVSLTLLIAGAKEHMAVN